MRANVVLMDGEVVAVVGVARHPEWGLFFSDHKPKVQPYLKSITVMRTVKDAMQYVKQYKGPLLTVAENAESCRLLFRLGFTHLYGAWYGWLSYHS